MNNYSNLGFKIDKKIHAKLKYYATLQDTPLQNYCVYILEHYVNMMDKKTENDLNKD